MNNSSIPTLSSPLRHRHHTTLPTYKSSRVMPALQSKRRRHDEIANDDGILRLVKRQKFLLATTCTSDNTASSTTTTAREAPPTYRPENSSSTLNPKVHSTYKTQTPPLYKQALQMSAHQWDIFQQISPSQLLIHAAMLVTRWEVGAVSLPGAGRKRKWGDVGGEGWGDGDNEGERWVVRG